MAFFGCSAYSQIMNIDELKSFLIYCGREGYAVLQEEDMVKEADHSTSIVLIKDSWKFHDNYFGGEPYGGREVVFYKDQPVWLMAYYGRVEASVNDIQPVYQFLRNALKNIPEEAPFRGPKEYRQDEWLYQNSWSGEVKNFSGEEVITLDGKQIYFARYIGGLVNQ